MKNKIENSEELFTCNDIAVKCPKKMVWDEMETVGESKRHCEGCDEVLFDVTGYTKEEVHALQKKHGSICVAVSKVLVAGSLSMSLLAASGEVEMETVLEENQTEVLALPVVFLPPTVELGLPVFPPPVPECDEGTKNLNAIKRFFGFDADNSCRED